VLSESHWRCRAHVGLNKSDTNPDPGSGLGWNPDQVEKSNNYNEAQGLPASQVILKCKPQLYKLSCE